MKFTKQLLILIACGSFLNINSGWAGVKRKTHFFSNKLFRCGGFDKGTWGECTDLTHIDLSKHKNHLQTKNRKLTGSTFENQDLSLVRFNSAFLTYVNFKNATLSNIEFFNSNLQYADFRGAELNQVKVSGNIRVQGALFDNKTDLSTFCDEEGNCGDAFALKHGMIYLAQSRDYSGEEELIGAAIKSATWDSETKFGIVEFGVQTESTDGSRQFLEGKSFKYHLRSKNLFRFLSQAKGSRVKVNSKQGEVVSVEKME